MKLNQEQFKELLLAYVEDEVSAEEARRVESYLSADRRLADLVAGMAADRRMVKALTKVSAPLEVTERILERVERGSLLTGVEESLDRRPAKWWQTRWAVAASLAFLVGGFGYIVFRAVWVPKPEQNMANVPHFPPPIVDMIRDSVPDSAPGAPAARSVVNAIPASNRDATASGNVKTGAADGTLAKREGEQAAASKLDQKEEKNTNSQLGSAAETPRIAMAAGNSANQASSAAINAAVNSNETQPRHTAGHVTVLVAVQNSQDTARLRQMIQNFQQDNNRELQNNSSQNASGNATDSQAKAVDRITGGAALADQGKQFGGALASTTEAQKATTEQMASADELKQQDGQKQPVVIAAVLRPTQMAALKRAFPAPAAALLQSSNGGGAAGQLPNASAPALHGGFTLKLGIAQNTSSAANNQANQNSSPSAQANTINGAPAGPVGSAVSGNTADCTQMGGTGVVMQGSSNSINTMTPSATGPGTDLPQDCEIVVQTAADLAK